MIFRPLVNARIVLPYMDNVIILAVSVEEAVKKLKIVLNFASEIHASIFTLPTR